MKYTLSQDTVLHPELVKAMQERLGCLMYDTTSTRPDIAFAVHQLCMCMHKPTPDLLAEIDHILSYLSRTSSIGLTYTSEQARLVGYADASWETNETLHLWMDRKVAISCAIMGLEKAKEHRLINMRSLDHCAIRGCQGRCILAQARQRSRCGRAFSHITLYRQSQRT